MSGPRGCTAHLFGLASSPTHPSDLARHLAAGPAQIPRLMPSLPV